MLMVLVVCSPVPDHRGRGLVTGFYRYDVLYPVVAAWLLLLLLLLLLGLRRVTGPVRGGSEFQSLESSHAG